MKKKCTIPHEVSYPLEFLDQIDKELEDIKNKAQRCYSPELPTIIELDESTVQLNEGEVEESKEDKSYTCTKRKFSELVCSYNSAFSIKNSKTLECLRKKAINSISDKNTRARSI